MSQRSATHLRTLALLLGCRGKDDTIPSRSPSKEFRGEASSSQPTHLEEEEVSDDMTLQEYQLQRRDFNFRPRKSFTRYTPSQWDKKREEVEEESEHDE